ncbi:MAG: Gfo/Idh/MocA family oxidoreductase [Ignavibacteriae bacterium]|nr:Gfo/Idh/MocA family oxidoreductase [Ignavibacteria bacterium]MBI3364583.1 Gfo/Idh/MocA family oxidoreductase [Ignavibacteriota bacterium]
MLRGALIGLGNIALRGHVPAYQSEGVKSKARIVAVMDVVEQSRTKANEVFPGATFYTSINTLLENEKPDFVDICTPPYTHAEYIKACAAKGIHVVCEKPLVEKYSTARELADAVKKAGIVFVPCHQYKYSPLWKSIRDVIASGKLGKVALAQFNVYRLHADTGTANWNPQWRTSKSHSGGGILVDTGAHYFYLAQYFFGIPQKISAILRTLKHTDYGVEDTAIVTLEYPDTLMQINLTWAANQRANSVYVAGEKGSLSYDGVHLLHTDGEETREIPMPDVSDKSQYVAWYAALFQEFICRIEQKNMATDLLDEAFMVMKLLDASYRSSEEKAVLDLV